MLHCTHPYYKVKYRLLDPGLIKVVTFIAAYLYKGICGLMLETDKHLKFSSTYLCIGFYVFNELYNLNTHFVRISNRRLL